MNTDKNEIKNICQTIITDNWNMTSEIFPDYLVPISLENQTKNDIYMEKMTADFSKQFQSYPKFSFGRKRWKRKTLEKVKSFISTESILGISKYIDNDTTELFQKELIVFLRQVRIFAPELNAEGIGQAIRNYIVYMMFVEIHEKKHLFNSAAFGYSMLYPITDNYIDSDLASVDDKKKYNQLIRNKLLCKKTNPSTLHQIKTCALLQMIADSYPNYQNDIFPLLLAMLDAQEESVWKQAGDTKISYDECLSISIFKGGISVFIDRFLVHSKVTEEDLIFYLGFGFFLQLSDDLQDIKEDSKNANQTIFTLSDDPIFREKKVNQMLNFVHTLLLSYPGLKPKMQELLMTSCVYLILYSVILSKDFFTPEFINKVETYLPVSASISTKWKLSTFPNSNQKNQINYLALLDNILY